MRFARARWFVLAALVLAAGVAEGAGRAHPIPATGAIRSLRPPGRPIPTPIHNEATCAFCQAGMVQPCPPPAAALPGAATALGREFLSAAERIPHLSSGRPASSRAPPGLRFA